MAKHAILSPSGAEKWVNCAGSARMEQVFKNGELPSVYAAEGTAAHFLAAEGLLTTNLNERLIGNLIAVSEDGCSLTSDISLEYPEEQIDFEIEITEEMYEHVSKYIVDILEFAGPDGVIEVEQAFDISPITGEEDAEGTADVVILRGTQLQVHDLKYGRKPVAVAGNKQLLMYAGAAYPYYATFAEIDSILLVIHQPRVNSAPIAWQITVDEMLERVEGIRTAAAVATDLLALNTVDELIPHLTPGEYCSKNYCKALADCPAVNALAEEFNRTDIASLDNIELLSDHAKKAPIIEGWLCAVTEVLDKRILEDGVEVPGFKAVLGREGNREWRDKKEVEQVLTQSMKLKHEVVYDRKVKTPTALEKHFKAGDIGPKQWPKIAEMITRSEAKLKVAPESDPRPAVLVKGDHLADFDEVE